MKQYLNDVIIDLTDKARKEQEEKYKKNRELVTAMQKKELEDYEKLDIKGMLNDYNSQLKEKREKAEADKIKKMNKKIEEIKKESKPKELKLKELYGNLIE